jgi:hypothetical protein
METINCDRGFLKCKIRKHNHELNNIGVFFGYSEYVCKLVNSVPMFDQEKYIRMYKQLNYKNIIYFLIEIMMDCNNDIRMSVTPLYFIVIFNILNTHYGRNLLTVNNKIHFIANNKLFDINDLPESHQYYYLIKEVFYDKLEVEIFHERLAYFYFKCKEGKKTIFSEFSENVDDSDNLFSEVVKFL